MQLALGRLEKSPFRDELVQEGRELLFCALELVGTKLPVRSRPEGQPFFLAALEELLRISGDPDFRAFYSSSVSFAHGVRVGFKSKTPRVRDGCTCRGIRRSLIASHFLTPPCLDFEQVLICFRCPSVQERISNRKKKGQWKGAAKFVASVVVFFLLLSFVMLRRAFNLDDVAADFRPTPKLRPSPYQLTDLKLDQRREVSRIKVPSRFGRLEDVPVPCCSSILSSRQQAYCSAQIDNSSRAYGTEG